MIVLDKNQYSWIMGWMEQNKELYPAFCRIDPIPIIGGWVLPETVFTDPNYATTREALGARLDNLTVREVLPYEYPQLPMPYES